MLFVFKLDKACQINKQSDEMVYTRTEKNIGFEKFMLSTRALHKARLKFKMIPF